MLTVNDKPRGFFHGEYKSTYPALANGQPVNKTADIPIGQGMYRRVDTNAGPMWSLPDQYAKKAAAELSVAANRRPKDALPTIFSRAADSTTRTTSDVFARGVRQNGVRSILGNLFGFMGHVGSGDISVDRTSRGLAAYPGSTRYYSENRQAITNGSTSGVALGVGTAAAQRKMQQKGYVDAGQFRIISKPQTF